MKLTKEDCYIALNDMYDSTILSKDDCKENREILAQLIEEHFSNPPLKFDELKEGMWVWDNNWNQYFEICEIYPQTKEFDVLIHQNRINKLRYEPMKFEENRFYRKQVIQ